MGLDTWFEKSIAIIQTVLLGLQWWAMRPPQATPSREASSRPAARWRYWPLAVMVLVVIAGWTLPMLWQPSVTRIDTTKTTGTEADYERLVTRPIVQPTPLSREEAASPYLQGRAFHMVDLVRDGSAGIESANLKRQIIQGKTFEDCDIYGPAVVAFDGSTLDVISFYGRGGQVGMLWEFPSSAESPTTAALKTGAIILRFSTCRRCRFFNIGIAGPKAILDDFVKQKIRVLGIG